jgi:predicted AlkP superfamily pyrophosphatase or phosphodiesterase
MRFVILGSAVVLSSLAPWRATLPYVDDVFGDAPHAHVSAAPAEPAHTPPHVLFVAWDGVRPDDLSRHMDRLPTLRALATNGAAWLDGSMRVSGPNYVSMPGYAELLTGTAEHGCVNNDCPGALRPTLFNDAFFENESCAAFSSWGPIARHFAAPVSCHLTTSFGRESTSDSSFRRVIKHDAAAYRNDSDTGAQVLLHLADNLPRLMFVSMGDTDECAHDNKRDAFELAMEQADSMLGRWLEAYRNEDVLTIVTTDHGRSEGFRDHGAVYPESKHTWAVVAHSKRKVSARRSEGYARDLTSSLRSVLGNQPHETDLFRLE